MKKGIITVAIAIQAVFMLFLFSHCTSADKPQNGAHKITIVARVSKYFYRDLMNIFDVKDEITLSYHPFPVNEVETSSESVTERITNEKVTWTLYADKPILVSPPFGNSVIMYPGDSLHILYNPDYPIYSGSDSAALALLDSLMLWEERIIKPRKKHSYNVSDLASYNDWNRYLDEKLAIQLPFIEGYKEKISPAEYEYYKAHFIGSIEDERLHAFSALYGTVTQRTSDLSRADLVRIWDSTLNKPTRQWLNTLTNYDGNIFDIYTFVWMEIYKQATFDTANIYFTSKEIFTSTLYYKARDNFKGKLREQLMVHILDEPTITEMGLENPATQALLKDYYSQPGYPEYKAWVKRLEKKEQEQEIEREKERKKKDKQVDEKQST